jgi:hypothetical protein
MLDLTPLFSSTLGTFSTIFTVTVSIAITYKFYFYDKEITLSDKVTQVEAARAQKGLPSEVTITPEDLRLNPELADILGVTDVNNPINITLETNAHLEYQQFQDTIQDHNNFIENTVEFLSELTISNLSEIVTYLLSLFNL